jgi:ATPase subunit of ABC transporter with duplicated ATPase domains
MELENQHFKIISGEMDPTSGHIHLEPGKRMSVLNQITMYLMSIPC